MLQATWHQPSSGLCMLKNPSSPFSFFVLFVVIILVSEMRLKSMARIGGGSIGRDELNCGGVGEEVVKEARSWHEMSCEKKCLLRRGHGSAAIRFRLEGSRRPRVHRCWWRQLAVESVRNTVVEVPLKLWKELPALGVREELALPRDYRS